MGLDTRNIQVQLRAVGLSCKVRASQWELPLRELKKDLEQSSAPSSSSKQG